MSSERSSVWPRWLLPLAPVLAAGVVLGVVLVLRHQRPAPSSPGNGDLKQYAGATVPSPPESSANFVGSDFVGSAVCAECHQQIAARYSAHPMAHSMIRVPEESPLETSGRETLFDAARDRGYWVEKSSDSFVHHILQRDARGETVYEQDVPVHYSIGSGKRGRSYAARRGDCYFMSPISWYTSNRRWDLSPGYTRDPLIGFKRHVTGECFFCHAGSSSSTVSAQGRLQEPVFHELAIGCERCHGAGGRHVERHRHPRRSETEDFIVNPAKLDVRRRDSVCNQCHLQGVAAVLRYGRKQRDYRPGDLLEETWTVFTSGTGLQDDGSTEAVSQVEQMMSSTCFQQSGGKLGCISCHDPHGTPAETERAAYYRQRCLQCHDDGDCSVPHARRARPPASNSCVHCHMPALPAHDVAHAAQTDHRILRIGVQELPETALSAQPELKFFDGADRRMQEWEADRALGIVRIREAVDRGWKSSRDDGEYLLRGVIRVVPDDAESLRGLALACSLAARYDESARYWKRILQSYPEHGEALTGLANALYALGDYAAAIDYAKRAIDPNPWLASDEDFLKLCEMLSKSGDLQSAIRYAETGLSADPSRTQLRRLLVDYYRESGSMERADEQQTVIDRLNGTN